MMTPLDATQIASLALQDTNKPEIQLQSTQLRISFVEQWQIKPGSRVLEVGCGQGDCTAVLATAVGETGHVTALDPAPPDYGSPFSLIEAQQHLSEGHLGSRITFIQATPVDHLGTQVTTEEGSYTYDYAVLAISLWYFSTPAEIHQTLSVVSSHARTICIAEWSLIPSKAHPMESYPHVLAALAQAALATRKPTGSSEANIRTAITPRSLKAMIENEDVGLRCVKEAYVTPSEKILDGMWEVMEVLSVGWEHEVVRLLGGVNQDRDRELLLSMRDAVRSALPEPPKAKGVRSMDVWCAVFERIPVISQPIHVGKMWSSFLTASISRLKQYLILTPRGKTRFLLMDNSDNPPNPDAERVQGFPDNGQPPNPSSSHTQAHVNSGLVNSLVNLREAVLRLDVQLTALSNELGEDRGNFSGLNPDLTNEIGTEELESTTNRILDFRRDIHSQVAQLSETARFWLEQDPEETAFMPPEVPPGSPETASAELGGPSFVPTRPPMIEAPQLLLGGSYHRPPLPELAHLNSSDLLHAHTPHEYNEMPHLLSASDSSYDDEEDLSEYRTRFQAAGGSTRNLPEDPVNDDYGMPGLMHISDSSDDEGAPADGENSSDDSGRDEDGAPEERAGPVRSELLYVHLIPPRVPYTRDPWVIPGSGPHQLLMQGRAPDDPTPPSVIGPEAGQPPQSSETREPHTGDAAWRSNRMQKLLGSLEVLDESMLDRFCRVGGGGGEHNDQCMICWESLKVEPIGYRSSTVIENNLSEENGHAPTHAGNLIATPGTSTSLTVPSDGSGAAALPCLHVFHFKCLVPWFDKLATTCPVCRFDLDPHKHLLFPVSALSAFQRLANRRLLTREWTSEDPLFHQAVVAREESRGRIGRSPIRQGVQSSATSPMQSIGADDGSWSSTEFSTEDSIPSLHSIPVQQNNQNIAEDTSSEHSSGDSMPPLSEPLANGASDPPTVETLATITPPGPASNGESILLNPGGINHDSSDEEPPIVAPTGADNTGTRESPVLEEVAVEDPVHSISDISTDVDSMPSLIAASEELDPMGRNSRAAREESRRDSAELVDQNGERYRDRSTASQAAMTNNPREPTSRDYAAETRTFLSEMQDTLLNAYVRFSNISTETATSVDALRAQASRWESLTSNRDVASVPSPSATSGIPTMVPVILDRPPLWMSSQDAARRDWVLPKGPVEGGVANWINKREAEIRGDLEQRPS